MSTTTESADAINPAHYKGNGLEAIDVIEQFDLGYHLGNAAKYLIRAGKKGDAATDCEKARWYLRRWIDNDLAQTPFGGFGALLGREPEDVADAFGLDGVRRGALLAILRGAYEGRCETEIRSAAAMLDEALGEGA